MDYFFASIVLGEKVDSKLMGDCFDECGTGKWKDKCCARVVMQGIGKGKNRSDVAYYCMDQGLGTGVDHNLEIDDVLVSIKCVGRKQSLYSGAKALSAGILSALIGVSMLA